jgi:hypothetical protein
MISQARNVAVHAPLFQQQARGGQTGEGGLGGICGHRD